MPLGKYIVIEGNDGTGKSTQVELLAAWLKTQGINSFIAHEPAGTPMADAIRTILKDGSIEREPLTNVLLFTAARHEIWKQARQALAKGEWVLSARNYLSTLAYQGYGDNISLELIQNITRQFIGEDYVSPDYTFILTGIDEADRNARISKRGELETPDTFEQRNNEFQHRVNNAYLTIANEPGHIQIDANQSIDAIQAIIKTHITTT